MNDVDVMGLPARKLGNGLVGFGVVGLVVTAILAVLWLAGLVATQNLDERLEADRQAMAVALADAASLLDSTATALEDSTSAIGSVSTALDDTALILGRLSNSTADLADALDITILGAQPFAGVAESFAEISTDLETFSGHADTLATEVELLEPDLAAIAADLRVVQESVADLAVRVEAFSGVEQLVGLIRVYILLSALLAGWLAVLAVGCIWAGRQLQQAAVTASGEPTPTS